MRLTATAEAEAEADAEAETEAESLLEFFDKNDMTLNNNDNTAVNGNVIKASSSCSLLR